MGDRVWATRAHSAARPGAPLGRGSQRPVRPRATLPPPLLNRLLALLRHEWQLHPSPRPGAPASCEDDLQRRPTLLTGLERRLITGEAAGEETDRSRTPRPLSDTPAPRQLERTQVLVVEDNALDRSSEPMRLQGPCHLLHPFRSGDDQSLGRGSTRSAILSNRASSLPSSYRGRSPSIAMRRAIAAVRA